MQVLAELIISNESRIIESNSVSFYNRMRSFKFTATIRYQVHVQPWTLTQVNPHSCANWGTLLHRVCWLACNRRNRYQRSASWMNCKVQAQLPSECSAGAADIACRTLTSRMAS